LNELLNSFGQKIKMRVLHVVAIAKGKRIQYLEFQLLVEPQPTTDTGSYPALSSMERRFPREKTQVGAI